MFGGRRNLSMVVLGMAVVFEADASAHLHRGESEAGASHQQVSPGSVALPFEKAVRNITKFPACIWDDDCVEISKKMGDDYRCFQYMCYPWNNSKEEGPFRSCKGNRDCLNLQETNGGDGSNGKCYRHKDRRDVSKGICLKESEAKQCYDDSEFECPSPLKCIGPYCGDPVYHEALTIYISELRERERELISEMSNFSNKYLKLTMFPCQSSELCQDLGFGSECCIDLSGSLNGWKTPQTKWEKRCCEPEVGGYPVIRPPHDITEEQIKNIDITVQYMVNFGLDEMICNSFEYGMMKKMKHCFSYSTTTTATTTTTTTTKKPKLDTHQTEVSLVAQIASIFLGFLDF